MCSYVKMHISFSFLSVYFGFKNVFCICGRNIPGFVCIYCFFAFPMALSGPPTTPPSLSRRRPTPSALPPPIASSARPQQLRGETVNWQVMLIVTPGRCRTEDPRNPGMHPRNFTTTPPRMCVRRPILGRYVTLEMPYHNTTNYAPIRHHS